MLTFRRKLSLGFGILIALLLLVGFAAFSGLSNSSSDFDQYRQLARSTKAAAAVQNNLLMMRMHVKDYLITSDESEVVDFNAYLDDTKKELKNATQAVQNPAWRQLLERQSANLSSYSQSFDQVVDNTQVFQNTLNTVLSVKGPALELLLTKLLQAEREKGDEDAVYRLSMAIRSFLLGRIYVLKFIESDSTNDIERVTQELAASRQELDNQLQVETNSAIKGDLAKSIALLNDYAQGVNTLKQAVFDSTQIVTQQLDVIGPKIAADLNNLMAR